MEVKDAHFVHRQAGNGQCHTRPQSLFRKLTALATW